MAATKKDIIKGIAPYKKEQEVLLRLIKKKNGLSSEDFDKYLVKPKFRYHKIDGDGYLLGLGINGFNEWAWHLDLLQHMIRIGLVDTERRDGVLYYKVKNNGTN